jgi:hypothetical protein
MAHMNIKWLHASGHAGSVTADVIDRAVRTNALVIDWSEMYWNIDDLKKFGNGYEHFTGQPDRKDARGRIVNHDVVLSVREDVKVLHKEEFWVDAQITPFLKYMPERHGKAMVLKFMSQVILVVAWHPQPNPLRRVGIVLPHYKRSVRRVQRVQRRLQKAFGPDLVLNGGDLQLGPGKSWVCPNNVADRLNMRTRHHKIDWQMFKGKGWEVKDFSTIDPSAFNKGMDHKWLSLWLQKEI